MTTSLEVAAFCGLLSGIFGASTWRLEGDPVAWTRVARIGAAYRETDIEANIRIARSIQLARVAAWIIVALSVVHALLMFLLTLVQEYETSGGLGDGGAFTGDTSLNRFPPEHHFDTIAAVLYGLSLIMTGPVIGAFARWGKDAAKDRTQACRPMPIVMAGVLAVGIVFVEAGLALHHSPHGNPYVWPVAGAYVGMVLVGAALVAKARGDALRITS